MTCKSHREFCKCLWNVNAPNVHDTRLDDGAGFDQDWFLSSLSLGIIYLNDFCKSENIQCIFMTRNHTLLSYLQKEKTSSVSNTLYPYKVILQKFSFFFRAQKLHNESCLQSNTKSSSAHSWPPDDHIMDHICKYSKFVIDQHLSICFVYLQK